jgi:hypothetical protein
MVTIFRRIYINTIIYGKGDENVFSNGKSGRDVE